MADSPLIPCETCQRHVRDEDTSCPFCGAPRTPSTLRAQWAKLAEAVESDYGRSALPAYGAPPLRRPWVWMLVLFLVLNAGGLAWLMLGR